MVITIVRILAILLHPPRMDRDCPNSTSLDSLSLAMGPIIHFLWHIRSHVSVLDFSEGKWKGFTRALPELWTDWLLLTCLLPGFIPPASYTIVSQKLSPYFDNFQPVFHSMQQNSMNGSLGTDMSLDYSLKMTIPLQEQTLSYCSSSKCKKLFWNSHGM